MRIMSIVGARPNFMKVAAIAEAVREHNATGNNLQIGHTIVHTGQHYDERMSALFFEELEIPKPHINLEVGSLSHAVQTAQIMERFEPVLLREQPDVMLVVGDVNSTIACALVASKLGIKVAHVEAGLRSFDRSMPEEINRVLTDAISDLLFITEEDARENLRREGIPENKIHFVGNVMIDTLLKHRQKAEKSDILRKLALAGGGHGGADGSLNTTHPIDKQRSRNSVLPYAVLTLHRPSNVDNKNIFQGILEALQSIGKKLPIIFPVHPRTLGHISDFGLNEYFDWSLYNARDITDLPYSINLIPPLGYLDFLHLMANTQLVLTDSGGIQEETTILGIPCVTLRENTERPVTVSLGTNVIAGTKKNNIISLAMDQLSRGSGARPVPPLWDGKAAARIVAVLSAHGHKVA